MGAAQVFLEVRYIGMCYEATHETLTDVKKRSKTNFLPNFVSFGGHGRSPHEVKLEARLWDKNA